MIQISKIRAVFLILIALGLGVLAGMMLVERFDTHTVEEISILERELYTWAKVKLATGKMSESDLAEIFDDRQNFEFSTEPSGRGFLIIMSNAAKQRNRRMTVVAYTLVAAGGLGFGVIVIRGLLSGKVGAECDGMNPPPGTR